MKKFKVEELQVSDEIPPKVCRNLTTYEVHTISFPVFFRIGPLFIDSTHHENCSPPSK